MAETGSPGGVQEVGEAGRGWKESPWGRSRHMTPTAQCSLCAIPPPIPTTQVHPMGTTAPPNWENPGYRDAYEVVGLRELEENCCKRTILTEL